MIYDEYNFVTPAKIETHCIICGHAIQFQGEFVPQVCDECKEAVKFAKEFMSEEVHITAKLFRRTEDD